jgi:hypothetical protein
MQTNTLADALGSDILRAQAAACSQAFEFLTNRARDIYPIKDGKPFREDV